MKKFRSKLLPPAKSAERGKRVVKCHNLRPVVTAKGEDLAAAPLPAVSHTGGWLPFAEVPLGDGKVATVCRKGNILGIIDKGIAVSQFSVDGPPTCALPSLGMLTVMTSASCYTLTVDSAKISGSKTAPLPIPRIYALARTDLSAEIAPVTLSKEYDGVAEASATDIRKISEAMNALYKELDANARAGGLWWQPVVVYAVMRNDAGNILYTTPPLLLTHPTESCFDGTVKLQSDDGRTTLSSTINAPSWLIKLDLPPNANEAYANVNTIEIMASPALHLSDGRSLSNVVMRRRADADYFCMARHALSSTRCCQRTVEDIISRSDTAFTCILSISKSSIRNGKSFNIAYPQVGEAASDCTAIAAALKKPVSRTDHHNNILRTPHSFTARRVANSGTSALWADLQATAFKGYGAELFSISKVSGTWHAAVKVTFSDGRSVVATSEGTSDAPTLFGPVLSYPAADAVSMMMVVQTGGKVSSGSFALTPDASGSRAIYVSDDARPFALSQQLDAFVIPDEDPPLRNLSDYLAAAPSTAPLQTSACVRLPGISINALASAHFGQSAWDFGRSRFYAMTTGGIFSLGLSTDRCTLSSSLIDGRKVASPQAVAEADNAVYALAGHEILRIGGTRVQSYSTTESGEALAWDGGRRELWCIPADGDTVEIICTELDGRRYTIGLPVRAELTASLNTHDYVASDTTAYRIGDESPFTEQNVEWAAEQAFDRPIKGLMRLEADIAGKVDNLSIDLRRLHLNRVPPEADAKITLSGSICSPLSKTIFLPPCHGLRCTLSGKVSNNFIFSSLSWT